MVGSILVAKIRLLSEKYIPALRSRLDTNPPSIPVIDLYQAFKKYLLVGSLKQLYADDGVHLSTIGSAYVTQWVEIEIDKIAG